MPEKQRLLCPNCGLPVLFDADVEDLSYEERLCNSCHEAYEQRVNLVNPRHIQQYLPMDFFRGKVKMSMCQPARNYLNRSWRKGLPVEQMYAEAPLNWIMYLLNATGNYAASVETNGPLGAKLDRFLLRLRDLMFGNLPEAQRAWAAANHLPFIEYNEQALDKLRVTLNVYFAGTSLFLTEDELRERALNQERYGIVYFLRERLWFSRAQWNFAYADAAWHSFQQALPDAAESAARQLWDECITFDDVRGFIEAAIERSKTDERP